MQYLRFFLLVYLIVASNFSFSVPAADYWFRIQGSNTVGAKLAPHCAAAFLKHKQATDVFIKETGEINEYEVVGTVKEGDYLHSRRIHIAAHGSSTGFKALLAAEAEVAMSSRPIKNKEVVQLSNWGDMTSLEAEHTIAIDGLAVLVNPVNPINGLTIEQVAKLFSGEITNWKELGGFDVPVTLYARDDRSGTWDTFKNLVLRKKYKLSDSAQRFESNDDLSDRVAEDKGGIGFSGLASVRQSKALAISDEGTQPLHPSVMTIATEDYPLSRRLYFYTLPMRKTKIIDDFVSFCQSYEGQEIVSDVGFVSQNILEVEVIPEEHWPETYRQLASTAKRLSVNFRFASGSSKLDNKASVDLKRMADYLAGKQGRYQVYLVGFTDVHERLKIEELISKLRALAVQARLMYSRVPVADAIGMGSFLPVAASKQGHSKLKNARVEIWLKTVAE